MEFFFPPALVDVASKDSENKADAENRPRLAVSTAILNYKGSGSVAPTDVVLFDLAFTQEPFFSSGRSIKNLASLPAGYQHPIGDAVVTTWIMDDRRLYIGCKIYLSVHVPIIGSPRPTTAPDLDMVFYLLFWGTAIKDASRANGASDVDITPRTSGITGV